MAEDSDLERTEPASQRRLDEARERGQVPRSPELSTFAVLLAGGGGLMLTGPGLMGSLSEMMRSGLTLDRVIAFDTAQMAERLFAAAFSALIGLSPLLLLVLAIAIATPMLVSGWLFSVQALQPNFSRLNPLSGLGRIFSWSGLIELGKAVLKTLVIGGVATFVVWSQQAQIVSLVGEAVEPGLDHLASLLATAFLSVVGAFALIVSVDVPFQIWNHHRQLRMTKDEVRQEFKETEGNPQVKSRIRALQREAARRRMMAEIPKADVIVTNPSHFAVALRYSERGMRAPRVVAKGSLLLAARIVQLAQEAKVPILHAPPLARALFAHADVGDEIPAQLYNVVAEVLAWVYQLRRATQTGEGLPLPPGHLPVPIDLDPGEVPA